MRLDLAMAIVGALELVGAIVARRLWDQLAMQARLDALAGLHATAGDARLGWLWRECVGFTWCLLVSLSWPLWVWLLIAAPGGSATVIAVTAAEPPAATGTDDAPAAADHAA